MASSKSLRWQVFAAVGMAIGVANIAVEAAQVNAIWDGGTGNWNTAVNWTPDIVPNNGANTYNVLIDNGNVTTSEVLLDLNATVDNVTVNSNDILRINNTRRLTLATGAGAGTINNAGLIHLNSTGSNTYLQPAGGAVTLTGGGILQLSNQTVNWIYSTTVGGSLTNVNNTIQGAGNIGWNGSPTAINNQGTILANVPNILLVDGNGVVTNTGTLRADSGGTLRLQAGTFNNAGGLIEALNASFVQLGTSPTIAGGTLSTTGSGVIEVINGIAVLDGTSNTVNNTGLTRINNAARLTLQGTINNTGTININSTASATYLNTNSNPVTLTGGGIVQLSNSANNWIFSNVVDGTFVNVDNTIQGAGHLGWNGSPTAISNQGTVIANAATALNVDATNEGFTNTGTLRADGGTLQLQGGVFNNTGGDIEALNASLVSLIGSPTIVGGMLSTTGSGVIEVTGPGTSTFDGTTNTGLVRTNNAAKLALQGTINNTGTIQLNSTGTATYLYTNTAPTTLTGGGVIQLSNDTNNWIYSNLADGSLINVDNTIRGSGRLGWNGSPTPITNQGAILADGSGLLLIDATDSFNNQGVLQVSGSGGATISGANFTTSGTVTVNATRQLTRTGGSYVQTAGTTTVNGTLTTSPDVKIQGGILNGSGTITGNLINGGNVAPGQSAGILSVTGSYAQTGNLSIEIGGLTVGTQYDRLAIGTSALLGGTLTINLINGYVPNVGDTFQIMTFGSRSGIFSNIVATCLPAGNFLQVDVANTYVLVRVSDALVGDTTCDCALSTADIDAFILALMDPAAYVTTYPCTIGAADMNGDGFVDGRDVQHFVSAFIP